MRYILLRVVIVVLFLLVARSSMASDAIRNMALGVGVSGPIIGVSGTVRASKSLGGRLIISPRGGLKEYDRIQLQLHYFKDPLKEKHWLLAVGGRDGVDYLRAGLGQNVYRWKGLIVNWDLALNIPLRSSDSEGAGELIDIVETLQVFGLGIHYRF